MMKSRNAFTMIELVFVIVILGILAAVAIPRLLATRDDASIAGDLTQVSIAIKDFGTFYALKGHFDSNVSQMTNVIFDKDTIDPTGDTLVFLDDDDNECLKFDLDLNGSVSLSPSDGESIVCNGLRDNLSSNGSFITYPFGGSSL